MRQITLLAWGFSLYLWLSVSGIALAQEAGHTAVPITPCEILASFPHDPEAFTQGLLFHDGIFYESTGLYGRSRLRKVEPSSGRVLAERSLEHRYFAEGLTLVHGRLAQLTWREGRGFLYDAQTLEPAGSFAVQGEGWGLALGRDMRGTQGEVLYLSQGTPEIAILDPQTFQQQGTLAVTLNGRPLPRLNELEWVEGKLYVNIWQAPYLAIVDPATGVVERLLDLTPCQRAMPAGSIGPDDVANGVAWDAAGRRLFVTGKRWPRLFQIALPQ
ncbi:glutaminyl-peptide cyclotransferase [Megalodesulfovibrio paquesii]